MCRLRMQMAPPAAAMHDTPFAFWLLGIGLTVATMVFGVELVLVE